MALRVRSRCRRAAADQEELEERLEGGHGSPAATGEESPHQSRSTHMSAGSMQRAIRLGRGRKGEVACDSAIYALPLKKRDFF